MAERRINWGADATDAKYRTEDTGTPGNFRLAEDLDGNTVLLEWDDTAGEWSYGGPVNMGGSDISNVGQLSSTSVSTELLDIIDASGNGEQREIAGFDEDLDDTTNLSLELTDIGSYDTIIFVLNVWGNGSDSTADVEITLNNSTSGYGQDSLNGGTITQTSLNSAWTWQMFDTLNHRQRFKISDGTDTYIRQETATHPSRDLILRGRVAEDNINSIQVSAAFNASGSAYAIGVKQ